MAAGPSLYFNAGKMFGLVQADLAAMGDSIR
jgi:hypothetical protein